MTSTLSSSLTTVLADPQVAGLRVVTSYESAIGPTVTPPAGTLRADGRDVSGEFTLPDGRTAVTVDSWGSQASRMEAAAEDLTPRIGFPLIRFVSPNGGLLTTSVRLSHRHADATWRAARTELEKAGIPFIGLQESTIDSPDLLLTWFPTSVLFGWWHSHTAASKKGPKTTAFGKDAAEALKGYARVHADARSARLVTGEIIASGVARRHRMAARSDTLFGPLKKVGGEAPSTLGIGSLPPVQIGKAPVDVTFDSILGHWYLSLAGLRRFAWQKHDPIEAASLAVGLALLLRESAAQRSFLRAGTELVAVTHPEVEIVAHGGARGSLPLPDTDTLCGEVAELGQRIGWSGPLDVAFSDKSVLTKLLAGSEHGETDES